MGVTLSKEFSVDGFRFAINKYPAGKSVRLLARLTKIAGKPLALLGLDAFSKKGEILDADLKTNVIAEAIESLATAASPEDFEQLIRDIMDGMIVLTDAGNRSLNFDTDFQGRPATMFKVLREILSFQYSDFLAGLGGSIPGLPSMNPPRREIKAL